MKKVISKDGTYITFDRSGKGAAIILVGGAFQYRTQRTKLLSDKNDIPKKWYSIDMHCFGRGLNAIRPIENTVRVREVPINLQKYLK